ncbi:MAG: ATP-binding protein [Anaerolineae bacterium]|nr:ATP-binding protein [Anaerolineae bacterium]
MSGGDTSYFGFEYQIYVSALVMLQHHLRSNFIQLKVETDFGNDAEAILENQTVPDHLSSGTLDVALQENALVKQIQVKTKSRAYQWQPSELRQALLKKDESRPRNTTYTILDRLIDEQNEIFIFITDGNVHPYLAGLLADLEALQREIPNASMSTIKETLINSVQNDEDLRDLLEWKLNEEILNRVFIVDGQRLKDIKLQISALLHRGYGIPAIVTADKTRQLVDLIRDRMLRVNSQDSVTKSDLEAIVGKPMLPIPYPDLQDKFIITPQYDQAHKCLGDNHLVILSGEPGVGKTTIARALINSYSGKLYVHEYPSRSDAHLDIIRACQESRDVIFELDDIFGNVNFDRQNASFGDQFTEVIYRLHNAHGRVKVIITSRENILVSACSNTRMQEVDINRLTIRIPFPSNQLMQDILDVLLEQDEGEVTSTLRRLEIGTIKFENLLHIREFAGMVNRSKPDKPQNIESIINATRPSAYKTWIAQQSDAHRLFMYILWSVVKTNQFAWEQDLRRIFEIASNCANLPKYSGFGTWFDHVIGDLNGHQRRVYVLPNEAVDFIHPQLMVAVEKYFESEVGFKTFTNCLIKALTETDDPLAQSVAVMLCLTYRNLIPDSSTMLKIMSESRYIQTLETMLRFGSTTLDATLGKSRENSIFLLLYKPRECELDSTGHLVRKSSVDGFSRIGDEEFFSWELGLIDDEDPEILEKFERTTQNANLSDLNPLERYKFGHWFYGKYKEYPDDQLFKIISGLAADPISFVRQTAADLFYWEAIINSPKYQHIFNNLCYDGHPYVKIEILEAGILHNWRFQPTEVQEIWLKIVTDMLDDPIVRLKSATGLVDMSGSQYWYHEDHTIDQKKQWFITIAPRLFDDEFKHVDHFERVLSKFEDYFLELPVSYRTELFQKIANYIKKHPSYAEDTVYTIERLVLEGGLVSEEREIIIDLIQNLSSWGRTSISYTFAREYNNLGDTRFQSFVHRPFFNETPEEYLTERAAALLGYLANDTVILENLPESVKHYNIADVQTAIRRYIFEQDDTFKRMVIQIAYRYKEMYHVRAATDNIFSHQIINELVKYFAESGKEEDASVIADILLRSGYYLFHAADQSFEGSGWLKIVDLLLYNDRVAVCKKVCDIIFAANILSGVHNARTFLMLVFRILNHPNQEVKDYAFKVFDNYFVEVCQFIFSPRIPSTWREEIKQTWLSEEFQNKLKENSKRYTMWLRVVENSK